MKSFSVNPSTRPTVKNLTGASTSTGNQIRPHLLPPYPTRQKSPLFVKFRYGGKLCPEQKKQQLCEFGVIFLNPSREALLFLGFGMEPWKKNIVSQSHQQIISEIKYQQKLKKNETHLHPFLTIPELSQTVLVRRIGADSWLR